MRIHERKKYIFSDKEIRIGRDLNPFWFHPKRKNSFFYDDSLIVPINVVELKSGSFWLILILASKLGCWDNHVSSLTGGKTSGGGDMRGDRGGVCQCHIDFLVCTSGSNHIQSCDHEHCILWLLIPKQLGDLVNLNQNDF